MSSAHTLNGFLKQYFEDRSTGTHRTLDEYVGMFPGDDAAIADHYERFESEAGGSGVPGDAPSIERIGRYRIVSELGRGGQGIVYHAEDVGLRRMVALKVLTGLGALAQSRVARFLREAEVASRLEHPGIARVHEIGMDDGVPFIAMQFVEGETLAARLAEAARDGERAIADAVSIIEKCARALHAAHEAGIVHRDVKPGNILIRADGDPVIVDFGLAHDADADIASLTKTGEFFGTPAYMSPEQFSIQPARPDRRTDVWSLGVTLYECLTLKRPFEAPTREGLYRAILMTRPRDPRELNPAISDDLRVVLETALERDCDRRYQTALDLAEDLRRVRMFEPIRAKPAGPTLRLRRWARRNPALAAALAGLLAALATGLVVALLLLDETRRERDLKSATLIDYDRLGDLSRLQQLQARADGLWPCEPSKVPAMKAWIAEGSDLGKRLDGHRETLGRLTTTGGGNRSHAEQFKYETTAKLVADLAAFVDPDPKKGLLAAVQVRLDFAESVERKTIGSFAAKWAEAIRSIADKNACPKYHGLEISPQIGLIPIDRDPASGLWEFAHLETTAPGADVIPKRGSDGRLVVTASMGIVFVLIPGGTFQMGAVRPDEDQLPSTPNVDPQAEPIESPVTTVSLAPFFLSKYEMTQAQWERVAGKNPSAHLPGVVFAGCLVTPCHPVEQVSWEDCDLWLGRLGLLLPTEAQWEYGARGGTTTPRWTGIGTDGLDKAANLADQSCRQNGGPKGWVYEAWTDGWSIDAPVGSLAPNPFGLHDVLGNVWEWCRDWVGSYDVPPRPGDGLRSPPSPARRVYRGGSYEDDASFARSALRYYVTPEVRIFNVGVRPARSVNP